MGTDKAMLSLNGESLLQLGLRRLQAVCDQVKILSGPRDDERDAALSCYAHLVSDREQGYAGPLAALASALTDCQAPYALLLAVDQPDVTERLLQDLIDRGATQGVSAACFSVADVPQPLPMLVASSIGPAVHSILARGERRLLEGVRLSAASLGHKMLTLPIPANAAEIFTNLNTPDDFKCWQAHSLSNQSSADASETGNGR